MIRDKNLIMSENQAITTTAASTNVLDLGETKRGDGNPLYVDVTVTTTLASGTSIKADLEHCDTAGGTYTVAMGGPVVLTAAAVAGKKLLSGALPLGLKKFVRINYTVSGTYDAGKVTAEIMGHPSTAVQA
jgi:hypothetical protein